MQSITHVPLMGDIRDYAAERAHTLGITVPQYIEHLVLAEVKRQVQAEHPALRGDCGAHTCVRCGAEWQP